MYQCMYIIVCRITQFESIVKNFRISGSTSDQAHINDAELASQCDRVRVLNDFYDMN